MIYFSFIEIPGTSPEMLALDATDVEAARTEAREGLRSLPGATEAHLFDGDRFVETVEAPAFGFAGVNAAEAVAAPQPPRPRRTRSPRLMGHSQVTSTQTSN